MSEEQSPMTLGEALDYLNMLSNQIEKKYPQGAKIYNAISDMYLTFLRTVALGGPEIFKDAHLIELDKPLCEEAYKKFLEISEWAVKNVPDVAQVKNKFN